MVKDAYTIHMNNEGFSADMLAMLACPVCHGKLIVEGAQIHCIQCQRRYPVEDGIPILLADRAQLAS